jgi:hypothetical protein
MRTFGFKGKDVTEKGTKFKVFRRMFLFKGDDIAEIWTE